jgi:hypothetical protein
MAPEIQVHEWWSCECGRHSYALLFVANTNADEEKCAHCGTPPLRLLRSTRLRMAA